MRSFDMKKSLIITLSVLLIVLSVGIQMCAGNPKEINRSFTNTQALDIETIAGDCIFRSAPGNEITVQVIYEYLPDYFEAEFEESGSILILREKFAGSCSGHSRWLITAPENTRIQFASRSGNIEIDGFTNVIKGETESGQLHVKNCRGKIQVDNDPDLMDMILRWVLDKIGLGTPPGRRT
jgi:hypothetical protein